MDIGLISQYGLSYQNKHNGYKIVPCSIKYFPSQVKFNYFQYFKIAMSANIKHFKMKMGK